MKVTPQTNPEVLLIEPKRFGDHRGYFQETFHVERYAEHGIVLPFVQDNLSRSMKGILRGLHLQNPQAQGKLVYVLEGAVFDVAVDVRVGSPRFGVFSAVMLTAEDHRQLWVPPGFAHGFCVTSDVALFAYKCTELYAPKNEMSVLWNDPKLNIPWPVANPQLSSKDQSGLKLWDIDPARLPKYEG